MSDIEIENNEYQHSSLAEIIKFLWSKKILISLVGFFTAVLFAAYSLTISNTYLSKAILSPAQDLSRIGSSSALNGLAGIAGINVPDGENILYLEGIEILRAFKFFNDLLDEGELKKDILAVKSWNPNTNQITYKNDVYDSQNKKWVKKKKWKENQSEPSDQEAFKTFEKIFFANRDPKSDFVTVTFEHPSPIIAQKWLDIIIQKINDNVRNREVSKAEVSITYLNEQLSRTTITEIKQVMSELVQNETQTVMLAKASPEFLYNIIEPPIVPETKFKPSRLLITIFGGFLGIFIVVVILLARRY